jgi:uncharacterized protein YcfJ
MVLMILAALMLPAIYDANSSWAQGRSRYYCEDYAHNYARRNSRGSAVGGAVRGGIEGAIIGGIADGKKGARRGAKIGGAVGTIAGGARQARDYHFLFDEAFSRCMRR